MLDLLHGLAVGVAVGLVLAPMVWCVSAALLRFDAWLSDEGGE